ncbi:hypothetical protein MUP00_03630 [Candidatus Bathyarchaeota archaeon]|nr:hypothetical protein [Candidatus Bathyarchaeota archaeon]
MTDTAHRNARRHRVSRDRDAQNPSPRTVGEDEDKALVRKVLLEIMLIDEVDVQRS